MVRKDYQFNPGPPSSITFTNPVDQTKLGAIFNMSSGAIIYNPGDPLTTGSLIGQTLTLTKNCSTMSTTDVLQVFYSNDVNALGDISVLEQGLFEGMTTQELLGQVLIELRVLNHQIYDMNSGRSTGKEDPNSLRTEILTNF